MNILDALKSILMSGGIENIYTAANPVVDHKYIDENYSIILSGKKYLNLWLIEVKKSTETSLSLKNNICDLEICIAGYLGFNYENDSLNTLNSIVENITGILRRNRTLNGECISITEITKGAISKKTFCNILCHYQEIIIKINTIKTRMEL